MEVNEINKGLYESAFIEDGEFGYHGRIWKPDIDERLIEEFSGDENGNYYPATPKQCDLLFQKMKEAGYCWDTENLELKKIGEDNSKFKEGDWVVNRKTGTIHQIKNVVENVSNNKNAYDLMNGGYISTSEIENYHVWKIENDAIPGDVLVAQYTTLIFKGLKPKEKDNLVEYFVATDKVDGSILIGPDKYIVKDCEPANKCQRDLFFAKLKEAGYDWDGDNLRLINLKESEIDEESDWTKNFNAVLSYIKDENLKDWLKNQLKLKEWSEEDEYMLRKVIISIDDLRYKNPDKEQYYSEMSNWLMSIKDQTHLTLNINGNLPENN